MPESYRRTVGERGQVTIPKELRERFMLHGGDEVVVRGESGRLVIERAITRKELAEGYRSRATRDADLAEEMEGTSQEAAERLGDAPEW